MDPKIVGKALKGAQRLMNDPGFNRNVANRAMSVTDDTYSPDAGYLTEAEVYNRGGSVHSGRYTQGVDPMDYSNIDINEVNSNLPKNILEAMIKNPINMAVPGGVGSSVLDNFDELERPAPVQRQSRRQVMNEQATPSMQMGGSIDYNYIKYLVSEALKENLQEMKKTLINENALAGLKLQEGGKIVLVDKTGNVFEAKLTKRVKQ